MVGEFADDGKSGLLDRSKRPGLDSALTLLERGEADRLIMLWKSRLSRDEVDRALMVRDIETWRVEWHAVADGGLVDRSTFAGYVKDKADEMIDTGYSIRVRENWRRAHQKRLDNGLPKTTNQQFGYVYEFDLLPSGRRTNGRYVVNDEADVVRALYRRYAQGVEGFTQLVRFLNDGGWTTSTGQPWTVRTLSRFLDSGFAAGFISREQELRHLRGAHEPLITESEWLAYRAQRDKKSTLGKKASGSSEKWWLAGLVRCGLCGGTTYVDSYARARGMVCCSNRRANPESCAGTSILRTTVERAVGLWLGGHLEALETLAAGQTDDRAAVAASAYAEAVTARDKIRDALADLEVRKSLGEVDGSVFITARDKLQVLLTDAERDVSGRASEMHTPDADTSLLRGAAERGWTADERVALRGVLDRVEVAPDGLTITPVSGDPMTRTRRELAPTCRVFGCDRTHYTNGLCKSHTMRAKSAGAFDALVEAVADDEAVVTTEDVEKVLHAGQV